MDKREQAWVYVQSLSRCCKGCPRRDTKGCNERCPCWRPRRIVEGGERAEGSDDISHKRYSYDVDQRRRRIAQFLGKQAQWCAKGDIPSETGKYYTLNNDLAALVAHDVVESRVLAGVKCFRIKKQDV